MIRGAVFRVRMRMRAIFYFVVRKSLFFVPCSLFRKSLHQTLQQGHLILKHLDCFLVLLEKFLREIEVCSSNSILIPFLLTIIKDLLVIKA